MKKKKSLYLVVTGTRQKPVPQDTVRENAASIVDTIKYNIVATLSARWTQLAEARVWNWINLVVRHEKRHEGLFISICKRSAAFKSSPKRRRSKI